MSRFSQYPVATSPTDYTDATNFLIEDPDGNIKLASLDGLSTFFCKTECAKVTIPSLEVLALFTTPKEIIPAQGAGTIIQPIAAIGKMSGNTLPYATNVTFNLYFNGSSSSCFSSAVFINTVLASPSYHQFQPLQPTIVSNSNIVENQPLEATVPVGNPTAGDGDLEIMVYYRIITV
jgi:hypothetical protein